MKQTQKEWARYIQDEIKKNDSYDNYKKINCKKLLRRRENGFIR